MWITIFGQEWLKRRLGDAMVLGVLIMAYVITGCDIPVKDRSEERAAATAEAQPPVVATPVSYETTAPEPTPPVATGPVSYEQAETAYRAGEYDDAVALFSAYLEQKPANPWGHYMLGLSAWKAGDGRTAETAFETALSLDPRHVKSMLGLSRVLIEEGRSDEALQELEFALEVDPTSPQVFRVMGRAYGELGRTDDAIAAYRDAIALDDTDVWALNNLGYLYIQTSQHSEAIGPLARAVEIAPEVGVFQNNLGIALERVGFAGSAVEAFRAALAADATFTKAQVNLERVESRGVDLDVMADLGYYAQQFVAEVSSWRDLVVGEFEVDTVPPDALFQEDSAPEPEPEIVPDSIPSSVTFPDSMMVRDSLPKTVKGES